MLSKMLTVLLKRLQNLLPPDAAHGYIIRTNAEGQPAEALAEDIAYLSRVWNVVERRGRGGARA